MVFPFTAGPVLIAGNPRTFVASAYGALGATGTADDAAIQAAINAASSAGGGTVLLGAYHEVANTLTVTTSNIRIVGIGADQSHDVGTQAVQAGTRLVWTGTSGGTMLSFASPSGASLQRQQGGGVEGVFFDSNGGNGGIALQINSWAWARFANLMFFEFTVAGISLNVVASLGEASDTQHNVFERITGRFVNQSGNLIVMDGNASHNTSFNIFNVISVTAKNGTALQLNNCDNNIFYQTQIFITGGGTGASVGLTGSNTSNALVARSNMFFNHSANVAVVAQGTGSFAFPSHDNQFFYTDDDNVTPPPTLGSFATAYTFGNHASISSGLTGPQGVVNADIGAIYVNRNGSTGATMWVKVQGAKTNTGWTAVA